MPATSVTDKFFEGKPRLVGKVGGGGVASESATTIPHTFVGLTEGNAYIVTVNRTDATGSTKNPADETETFIGEVSGSNFINCDRQVEGEAQAWSTDTVLEILVTATIWNKLIEGIETEHNKDGTHKEGALDSIIPGSEAGGDMIYHDGSTWVRLAKGTDGEILKLVTGFPSWEAESVDLMSTTKYAPQGFLINGKIAVSVASNNITVAIKGMDGNDPSAGNPVYCRIGDTVRTITAALSVTKNAGTNWFGSGGATLATLERDYFVYLGYNATDGVVIGFSPVPYATSYGDFSATTTNEKYCAISTIANAASTDYYENIGRFAATLSATASFNWSVPTFTATNLIQRPIYETRWLSFTPAYSTDGSAFTNAPATNNAQYKIQGINQVHVRVRFTYNSTSGGSGATLINIPFAPAYTNQTGFGTNYNSGASLNVRTNGTAAQLYVVNHSSSTNIANNQGSDVSIIMNW